jgi:hypothetical protein
LTIHLPKSPRAIVSSCSAGNGRYNKAPCLPEHEYVTCASSSGLIKITGVSDGNLWGDDSVTLSHGRWVHELLL